MCGSYAYIKTPPFYPSTFINILKHSLKSIQHLSPSIQQGATKCKQLLGHNQNTDIAKDAHRSWGNTIHIFKLCILWSQCLVSCLGNCNDSLSLLVSHSDGYWFSLNTTLWLPPLSVEITLWLHLFSVDIKLQWPSPLCWQHTSNVIYSLLIPHCNDHLLAVNNILCSHLLFVTPHCDSHLFCWYYSVMASVPHIT
jgi:hypothetical protein